jgi:histidine decarboxylase
MFQHVTETSAGFPTTILFDHSVHTFTNLSIHSNNVGDPFIEGAYRANTKVVERAVLDHYAKLFNISIEKGNDPTNPLLPNDYWGYILSMGSTEGNIYALYTVREYLTGMAVVERNSISDQYII